MEKVFIFVALVMVTLSANAQLRINSTGRVIMADEVDSVAPKVIIGVRPSRERNYSCNLYSATPVNCENTDAAIIGSVSNNNNGGMTAGIVGYGGTNTEGNSFGVYGQLLRGRGSAIYGTSNISSYSTLGTYAGLFSGPVLVQGTLCTNSILNTSDINLKENICSFNDSNVETALSKVLNMNVVKYNFISFPDENDMSLSEEEINMPKEYETFVKEERERQHFGLIAQELQTIYPNLVVKGQDGYLSINYIELVPVLIQSIQDLKKELDEIKGYKENVAKGMATRIGNIEQSNVSVLYQNSPNPFNESTVIRYQLADNVKKASIYIFDMQGKILKKYNIGSFEDHLTINAFELGEGMFLYTLIADGKEIDTKRMILTK